MAVKEIYSYSFVPPNLLVFRIVFIFIKQCLREVVFSAIKKKLLNLSSLYVHLTEIINILFLNLDFKIFILNIFISKNKVCSRLYKGYYKYLYIIYEVLMWVRHLRILFIAMTHAYLQIMYSQKTKMRNRIIISNVAIWTFSFFILKM